MPLSDEQRSLLQLLLEGGQGYDDIASLLGVSPDEVRSRAREALTEMGGADPDAQVAVSDFLLGKADPIGRADAVRHLQNDPEANALAARLLSQLRLLAPRAELPQIPEPKGGRVAQGPPTQVQPQAPSQPSGPAGESFPATGAKPTPSTPTAPSGAGREPISSRIGGALGGPSDPKRRSQMIAIIVGAGLLLLVGVLFIAGVFGSDDDGGSTETTASTPTDPELTIVNLTPTSSGNSGASGQAVFAQAQDQPLLQINLTGLEPAGEGQNYIVWLYNSDRVAFPLARDQVGQNGNLTGAAPIPQQLLPLLSQFGCVDVSLASNEETQAALQQAVEGQSLPRYSGTSVLRGEIPTEAGQQAASGADSQCERTVAAAEGGGQGGNGGGQSGEGGGQ